MNDDTKQNLKKVFAKIMQVAPELIDDNSSTANLPNWDSLRHMKLIITLEEEFGFNFDEEQIVSMTSFGVILKVIQQELQRKSG
jgi:acyl carrier protein